jgi:hopanoid biosynthesis associated protein HpnK
LLNFGVRRLIINADDFGLTDGINRGILEAHARGIVSSTTLMATGGASGSAVALSTNHPRLSIGCHIVLVDGSPVSDPTDIPSLLDNSNGTPAFRQNILPVVVRATLGRLDPEHVEAEAIAQIRAIQAKGVAVSHFDTHKHTHMFPSVLSPLLRAARACGVNALRNPFGPRLPFSVRNFGRRRKLWKRFLEVQVLSVFASSFRKAVENSGMRTPDGSFGVISTGSLDLPLFRAIVDCIPDGTWEFVCHPGYNDAELASVRTRLRDSRDKELEVLTSKAAREALERRGIQLISYREL